MEVWMLTFGCCDYDNFNGVFSTKEKAIDAFFTLCKNHNEYWSNACITENDEDFVLLEFDYTDENDTIAEMAFLTKVEMDKINI